MMPFPQLPEGWEATRATLHAHARTLGVVARSHVLAHPRWWHVSLSVTPRGLHTDPIQLPSGSTVSLLLDLEQHGVAVEVDDRTVWSHPVDDGSSAMAIAGTLFSELTRLGLDADGYDRTRLGDDQPRQYDRAQASAFFAALKSVAAALERERSRRDGEVGPVQVWPHGFDIAFEWFGTRLVDDPGTDGPQPAQLNLGWYPGGDAYFYSNPWPFDERLLEIGLPAGAAWHTDGWQGSILPYAEVAGAPDGEERFARYATAVHAAAAPTLMA